VKLQRLQLQGSSKKRRACCPCCGHCHSDSAALNALKSLSRSSLPERQRQVTAGDTMVSPGGPPLQTTGIQTRAARAAALSSARSPPLFSALCATCCGRLWLLQEVQLLERAGTRPRRCTRTLVAAMDKRTGGRDGTYADGTDGLSPMGVTLTIAPTGWPMGVAQMGLRGRWDCADVSREAPIGAATSAWLIALLLSAPAGGGAAAWQAVGRGRVGQRHRRQAGAHKASCAPGAGRPPA
jgi:hypothetical protein